jgi:hypothetical protein
MIGFESYVHRETSKLANIKENKRDRRNRRNERNERNNIIE